MAIPRKRTLQELLSSIAAGPAPVYAGRATSPKMPRLWPTPPSGAYNVPDFWRADTPNAKTFAGGIQEPPIDKTVEDWWLKPQYRGDRNRYQEDVVDRYQDVNPYIYNTRTGKPSRSNFDSYIQLLSDRHPTFMDEYRANPHAAFEKYEGESGLSGDLMSAYDYHSGANVGTMITPNMVDLSEKQFGRQAVYGDFMRPHMANPLGQGLLTSDPESNSNNGILGNV